jgi:hypothetical protein
VSRVVERIQPPLACYSNTAVTRRHVRPGRDATLALGGWVILVASGSLLVYHTLIEPGIARLDAAPLHGALDVRLGVAIAVPIAVGALAVRHAIRLAHTLSWRGVLASTWLLALTWAVALSVVRGTERLTAPLRRPGEYLAVLPDVNSLADFLAHFTERLAEYPVHVQGHPPGFVVLAWFLRGIGLPGPGPVALLCLAGGAAAAPLVLITVRAVAGTECARRAAPFVALSPAAIWVATSADAFYAGLGAGAVALVVVAVEHEGRRSDTLALAGGLLFGVTALMSYGLVLLAAVPLVFAARRRRVRPIAMAVLGAIPVLLAFAAAGFFWLDGLAATRARYLAGIASRRPYGVFLVANLSSFAIALGPAIAVAVVRLRDTRLRVVVGAALAAVAIADLSGMSKSEVERIWLPFTPFVLAGGAALVGANAARRPALLGLSVGAGWLAVQATAAIVVESVVRTGW